jgi:hypothetical protein
MKVLHLTLKRKWFDMIASGEKKEEYRDLKLYWSDRLGEHEDCSFYEAVKFRNGYRPDSPIMVFKIEDIIIGEGRPEWGAEPGRKYFIIKLGDKLSLAGDKNDMAIAASQVCLNWDLIKLIGPTGSHLPQHLNKTRI